MIWRLCLHTHVEVIGGEVNWQPDNLDRSQQEYLIDFESCGVDEDGYSNDNSQSRIFSAYIRDMLTIE